MTSPGMQEPIDTPTKILESELPIGMYNYQGSTTIAFSSTRNPNYLEIWDTKEWVTSFDETYKKVISGEAIFMDYRFALEAAVIAGYTDPFGLPLLHLADYNTFRYGVLLQMTCIFLEKTSNKVYFSSPDLERDGRSNQGPCI